MSLSAMVQIAQQRQALELLNEAQDRLNKARLIFARIDDPRVHDINDAINAVARIR